MAKKKKKNYYYVKSDCHPTVDSDDFSHEKYTPCSNRAFADVLLHEFMHHYDYYYLKLSDSVHSKGFSSRVRDLKEKLKKAKK